MNSVELRFANNQVLLIDESGWEHMTSGHPEVTLQILQEAVQRSCLTNNWNALDEQTITVDLADKFGLWANSGVIKHPKPVDMDQPILFGFRGRLTGHRDRLHPTPVSYQRSERTSLLRIWIKKTSFLKNRVLRNQYSLVSAMACSAYDLGPEPLGYGADPETMEGRELRKKALDRWRNFALSIDEAELRSEAFISTWNEMLKKYHNVYKNERAQKELILG
jgi:hypothetical protein